MVQTKAKGISSFSLHILAMALMLGDHLWATLFPAQEWLTCIGRIAFPIFAFMIVEGFFHTSNVRRYISRIFIFAIVSEIPFNLIYGSSLIYPFHQNFLWTFLIALLCITFLGKIKEGKKWWVTWPVIVITALAGYLLGTITMVDYYGAGVLTVLTFYIFHERKWWCFLGQFMCLAVLNIWVIGGYFYPVTLAGYEFQIVQQGFALLSLIPIWLYHGRQGYHSKWFQYVCYAFYPAHLLLLYWIWQWAI